MGRLVRRSISLRGLYQGFDSLVWCVVALQVFGGLIVGMVVKYADNIQKNFANALSVIFTVLGAIPLFGQVPSAWFVLGVFCTMTSVFMYQKTMPSVSSLSLLLTTRRSRSKGMFLRSRWSMSSGLSSSSQQMGPASSAVLRGEQDAKMMAFI